MALFLAVAPASAALARDITAAESAVGLAPFASDEGLARLSRSDAKVNFPALANQFEAEYNGAFCGPASATMVLNAVRSKARPPCRMTKAACARTTSNTLRPASTLRLPATRRIW